MSKIIFEFQFILINFFVSDINECFFLSDTNKQKRINKNPELFLNFSLY